MSLCTLLKQLRERQRLRVADVATLLDKAGKYEDKVATFVSVG